MRSLRMLAAALLVAGLSGCGYNTIQTEGRGRQPGGQPDQGAAAAAGGPDPQPGVETVKGFAQQDSTVLVGVTEARARLNGAIQGGILGEMAAANQGLTGSLGRLIPVAEGLCPY